MHGEIEHSVLQHVIFISEIAQGYGRKYSRLTLGVERRKLLVYKLPKSFTFSWGYSCTPGGGAEVGQAELIEEMGVLKAGIMVGRS